MNIYEETKFLMKKYNISANKDLGQNFLIDDNVIENIVEAAEINEKRLCNRNWTGIRNINK